MQVLIASTSSRVDDMILIETKTTIGENTTTQRVGYDVTELMDNRYLAGTLEERTEALRQSAERMTETSVRLHFEALMKHVVGTPKEIVEGANTVLAMTQEEPVKKPRKARTTKTKPVQE
ncbi:hypothetical protein Kurepalu2_00011 [Pseudomonas phage vB_PpuP-Kurepalu-2]